MDEIFGQIMKKTFIEIMVAFVIAAIVAGIIFCIFVPDRWVDLRTTWPKGTWLSAQFVIAMPEKDDSIVFSIPSDKLLEFEKQLKQAVEESPKMENPQWDIYQLHIVTTKRTYKTAAFISEDRVMADTWMSENLKKSLGEWGYKKP
jgi:hypothetical protein